MTNAPGSAIVRNPRAPTLYTTLFWRSGVCSRSAALLSSGRIANVPTTKLPASTPSCHVKSERRCVDVSDCAAAGDANVSERIAARARRAALQRDLTRLLEVGQEHLLGVFTELLVFDDGVELVVD